MGLRRAVLSWQKTRNMGSYFGTVPYLYSLMRSMSVRLTLPIIIHPGRIYFYTFPLKVLPVGTLSILPSFKIQVEYLMLICYNRQGIRVPNFKVQGVLNETNYKAVHRD